jgi:hypothetical protein
LADLPTPERDFHRKGKNVMSAPHAFTTHAHRQRTKRLETQVFAVALQQPRHASEAQPIDAPHKHAPYPSKTAPQHG